MVNILNREKSITIFLMGGAGNQLFQIARAHSLRVAGHKVTIANLGSIEGLIYRLLGFTRHDNWFNLSALLKTLRIPLKTVTFYQLHSLFWMLVKRRFGFGNNSFFDSDLDKVQSSRQSIDVGYFQSLSKVSLDSLYAVANSFLIIHSNTRFRVDQESVVLHLRGGDFGKSMRLENEFIERILVFCRQKSIPLDVVTNDASFYRELFEHKSEARLVRNNSALQDFLFLVSARHLVVSNSTFSFWAMICASITSTIDVIVPQDYFFKDLRSLAERTKNLNILDFETNANA